MNKSLTTVVLLAGMLMLSSVANSAPLTVSAGDSMQTVLSAHKGKQVGIKLESGEELTGKVGDVTDKLLVLQKLSGKEFFDAVVRLSEIAAVIVRARE